MAHRDSARAACRPLGAGERIDIDRAAAAELARLPRVGPALARAIVGWRQAHGPFGSLQALQRGAGDRPRAAPGSGSPRPAFSSPARAAESAVAALQAGPAPSRASVPAAAASPAVDLNLATAQDLDRLPGIGPAKAQAIVAYRERHGPFRPARTSQEYPESAPPSPRDLQNLAVVR